jgi:hypothetical protein
MRHWMVVLKACAAAVKMQGHEIYPSRFSNLGPLRLGTFYFVFFCWESFA